MPYFIYFLCNVPLYFITILHVLSMGLRPEIKYLDFYLYPYKAIHFLFRMLLKCTFTQQL